ncbi:hypothetical protein DFH11DRAFT_1603370 [Phellopilus nigrolimitatus]|nr:hypothetical protein DFH11DRAFT_1603370 [Phellopilus nigrolimitatus]
MKTRALYAYRHKEMYYVHYIPSNSSPRGLGMQLVNQIPPDRNGFEAWLKEKRYFYDIESERFRQYQNTRVSWEFEKMEEVYAKYFIKPRRRHPVLDYEISIFWIYTLDLDRLIFSVDEGACFRLDNIPRGEDSRKWIRYLSLDGCGKYCLRPDTPGVYVAPPLFLPLPSTELEKNAYLRAFPPSIGRLKESAWLAPEEDQALVTSAAVASAIVRGVIMDYCCDIFVACNLPPESDQFQAMAELVLRAAAPGSLILTEACGRAPSEYLRGRSSKGKDQTVFYRFRGCIILLTNKLDANEHLKENIGLAVSHAVKSMTLNCTVLIFSILRVAVAVISIRGYNVRVSVSEVYQVVEAYGRNEEEFRISLRLLSHFLRPHCTGASSSLTVPLNRWPLTFRSSASGTRRPIKNPSLPYKVIFRIMRFADSETYSRFQFVSKALRREWAAHPRISDYTIQGVTTVNRQENIHLPDVTFSAWTKDGSLTPLDVFYTELHAKDFNFEEDFQSSPTYPSPYANKKAHWKPLVIRLPLNNGDCAAIHRGASSLRPDEMRNMGLYILDEGDVPERCECCQVIERSKGPASVDKSIGVQQKQKMEVMGKYQ